MKYIHKQNEPLELIEYKTTPGVSFEGWHKEVRDPVKKSLVEEQGFICCYCQSKIDISERTIVEHLLPKERKEFSCFQLYYTNLLASCDGGQGMRAERDERGRKLNKRFPSNCDDNKGNNTIPISPLDPTCEEYFLYGEDGSIFPRSGEKNSDEYQKAEITIRVLNLDNHVLRAFRKAEFEGLMDYTIAELTVKIEELKAMTAGKYYNFCAAIVCFIENYRLPMVATVL